MRPGIEAATTYCRHMWSSTCDTCQRLEAPVKGGTRATVARPVRQLLCFTSICEHALLHGLCSHTQSYVVRLETAFSSHIPVLGVTYHPFAPATDDVQHGNRPCRHVPGAQKRRPVCVRESRAADILVKLMQQKWLTLGRAAAIASGSGCTRSRKDVESAQALATSAPDCSCTKKNASLFPE